MDRTFPTDDLIQMAYGDEPEGYKVLETELTDTTRWSLLYTQVFSFLCQVKSCLSTHSRQHSINFIFFQYLFNAFYVQRQ